MDVAAGELGTLPPPPAMPRGGAGRAAAARRPPPRRTLRHRCSRVLQSICARFNTGRTGTSGAAAAAVLSSQPMDTSMLSNMANVPMMVSATKYETKEGIYGEYQVEVKEQAVDDARR